MKTKQITAPGRLGKIISATLVMPNNLTLLEEWMWTFDAQKTLKLLGVDDYVLVASRSIEESEDLLGQYLLQVASESMRELQDQLDQLADAFESVKPDDSAQIDALNKRWWQFFRAGRINDLDPLGQLALTALYQVRAMRGKPNPLMTVSLRTAMAVSSLVLEFRNGGRICCGDANCQYQQVLNFLTYAAELPLEYVKSPEASAAEEQHD